MASAIRPPFAWLGLPHAARGAERLPGAAPAEQTPDGTSGQKDGKKQLVTVPANPGGREARPRLRRESSLRPGATGYPWSASALS